MKIQTEDILLSWKGNGKMYWEMKKILSRKRVWLILSFLLAYIIYSAYTFGSRSDLSVSEEGELIRGKEAVLLNQEKAEKYKGIITEEKLKEMADDYKNAPVGYLEGRWKRTNTAFGYIDWFLFQSPTLSVKVAHPRLDEGEELWYGYSDMWEDLFIEISELMNIFSLFMVIAFPPVISFDKECRVYPLIITSRDGKKNLLKKKMKACFLIANVAYFIGMTMLCGLLFIQYGLCGYDTSIQCGGLNSFYDSDWVVTFGYLFFHVIVLDWLVVNVLVLVILLVSGKTVSSYKSMAIAFVIVYFGSMDFIRSNILNIRDTFWERILSILPDNALCVRQVVNVPKVTLGSVDIHWFYVVEMIYVLAFVFFYIRFNKSADV